MDNKHTPHAAHGAGRSDQFENYERYLLYNRAGIVQKLRQLAKGKNLLTAHFGNGRHSMLTAVVDVMPDKELLVLDYGSDDELNQQLLHAERAVFKTTYEGITAQFTCSGFQKARRHGQPAIACQLPETLLWVQRREYYRVRVPFSEVVSCEIYTDTESFLFPTLDLSIGGVALHHTQQTLQLEEGQAHQGCKLRLPGMGEGLINLEVRNIVSIGTMNNGGYRVGCQFLKLGMDMSATIQRYIHNIEAINMRVKSD